MTINAYIDTNIYVYVALNNIRYFEKCKRILEDASDGKLLAYGSLLVATEILGSLSRIDPRIAQEALKAYLSMPVSNLEITPEVLQLAALINTVTNIKYDSIHAAVMILNGVSNIITNDIDDWILFKDKYTNLKEVIVQHGFEIKTNEFDVITVESYPISV
ncbi:MAG: type II toxin-antitoxin system VapC family toxin [Thermoproteota archaeon]|jgi:predicted nucleic acid-binding protein